MNRPPTGTVTFLFTDVEGSSRQWEADAPATEALVAAHDKLVRTVVDGHDGYVFTTMGDGFAVAFQRASQAVAAAVELQESLAGEEWATNGLRVRMGVHTGEAVERDGDYFGPTVNRTARIMALAHGGQILLSRATADLVPELDTVELGEYQLRGLTRPERLYQVVAAGLPRKFRPLRGDQATANNLPKALTSFLGRQAEIDDLAVRATEGRLITLVGPGGAGKTRLAIEAGLRLLDEFPDGVWLAELSALRDPAQVASSVAKAMGHHDPLAEAGGPGLVRDRLAVAIGGQRVLLIVDNCEHLIEAAADLAAGLLGLCPRLVVLATSRQSLGVAGEQLVEVGALSLPAGGDAAGVAASEAGALFVQRAQAVHPRFQLDAPAAAAVAEVCRRLEGLPLAIELAAARARLLTVAQIAERLEETLGLLAGGHGGVERHQTMRAALAWSYDLLGEAEQDLFRRLAVFRNGFILEAAAAVAPGVSDDILDVLGGLVDKSLVLVVDDPAGQRRFRLLEPVRQFAADLLNASGERDDAASRQRDHLVSRLPTWGTIAPGSAAFEGLAAELENVRAAVEHCMRNSKPVAAIELITAYELWWMYLGLQNELVDRLADALRTTRPASMPLDALTFALDTASTHAAYLGRMDEAVAFADQLAELRQQHPGKPDVQAHWAFVLATLNLFGAGGDLSYGNRLMRESQHAYEACGQPALAAAAAMNIPWAAIAWDAADDPEVARAIKDCTLLAQTTGFPSMASAARVYACVIQVMAGASDAYPRCLDALAELDALDGGWLAEWSGLYVGVAAELVREHALATAHALRWVQFCRRSGVRMLLPCGIRAGARLCAKSGYPQQAQRLWGAAGHVETVTGMRYMPLMERLDRSLLQQCTDAIGADAARLVAEGASWSVAEATQAAEEALVQLQADNNWEEPNATPVAPPAT
jgi:predicted ATPase/class 3 adenylate cyclase